VVREYYIQFNEVIRLGIILGLGIFFTEVRFTNTVRCRHSFTDVTFE